MLAAGLDSMASPRVPLCHCATEAGGAGPTWYGCGCVGAWWWWGGAEGERQLGVGGWFSFLTIAERNCRVR